MSDKDTIYRQSAIDAVSRGCQEFRGIFAECEKNLNELPPAQSDNGYSDGFTDGYKRGLTDAQPDNQINLCDSCDYSYPDCPSKDDDVIFGNGIGNDNICACNKYKPSAQPEIIYCKKCKHWTETCGDKRWGLGDCDVFDKHLVMCNGYCAWAERREE